MYLIKINGLKLKALFLHDIALLINNKQKKGYLWCGPRSPIEERDRASKLATDLMEKYSMYELIVLGDSVPLKIEAEIESIIRRKCRRIKNENRTYKNHEFIRLFRTGRNSYNVYIAD